MQFSLAAGAVLCVVLALSAALPLARGEEYKDGVDDVVDIDDTDVVVLTDRNFDDLTSDGSWLVEFYAPWCGHCKKLAPVFAKAATRLKGKMFLGKVDCVADPGLGARFGIKSYPTIKFFRDNSTRDYRDDRTFEAFVRYGRSMTRPPVQAVSTRSIEAVVDEWDVVFAYFGSTKRPEYRSYERVARQHQGKFAFVRAETAAEELETRKKLDEAAAAGGDKKNKKKLDEAAAAGGDKKNKKKKADKHASLYAEYGVSEAAAADSPVVLWISPYVNPETFSRHPTDAAAKAKVAKKGSAKAVVAHDDDDDDEEEESGGGERVWTETQFGAFVLSHALPLLSEMGPSNFEDLTSTGKLVVFAVTDPAAPETNKYLQAVVSLAKQYRHQLVFGNIDGIKYGKYVAQFGLTPATLPTVFVFDYPNERYFSADPTPVLASKRAIVDFLEDVLAGRSPPKGTSAWYNPAKLWKQFETYLQTFSETQLMWMIGTVMTVFVLMLLAACYFSGFADDAGAAAGEIAGDSRATAAAADHAKSD